MEKIINQKMKEYAQLKSVSVGKVVSDPLEFSKFQTWLLNGGIR